MADKPKEKKKKHLPQRIIGGLGDLLEDVNDLLRDDSVREAIRADLGLDPKAATKDPPPPDVSDRFASIQQYRTMVDPDKEALAAAIADLKAIYEAITAFIEALEVSGPAGAEEAVDQVFHLFTVNFLRLRVPLLFWVGQLAGLIEQGFTTETIPRPVGEQIVGVGETLVAFIRDPVTGLKRVKARSLETEDDARLLSQLTFIPLSVFLGFLHKKTKYLPVNPPAEILFGWEPSEASSTPIGDQLARRAFSFAIKGSLNLKKADPEPARSDEPCNPPDVPPPNQSLETTVTTTMMFVPRQHGGPGFFLSFGGSAQLQLQFADNWKLTLGPTSAGAVNFLFRSGGVDVGGPADAAFSFLLQNIDKENEERQIIALSKSTRLELGHLSLSGEVSLNGLKLAGRATDCALIIGRGCDPLTDRSMPSDEMRVELDLGLGFADGRFFIEGGSGLEATLPASKALGPIRVQALTVRLVPSTQPGKADLSFDVLATLSVKLGPITITASKMGLGTEMELFDDFRLVFRAPEGLGILIDSAAVSGGGFLARNASTGEYFGAFELSLHGLFSVKAIGVVSTKPTFSFAAIIMVTDFRPINLGLGFRLTGVGGILGLDRTLDFAKLQSKLEQGVLSNLLFPKNPVANAPTILADLTQVFPPARDQVVFGPMVQIVWGADGIVNIQVALLVQPPAVRVMLLGTVDVYFPNRKAPLVEIHVHVIGDFDFDRKLIFLGAKLVKSRIVDFTLDGDAALFLSWGDTPAFILSFGGFNQRYQPQVPKAFPPLKRLTVALVEKKNLSIVMTAYLAVTSNSFQIGGSISLKASKKKFSIEGNLTVDALFQSGQPCFIFDLSAKVSLKAFDVTLFSVKVEGTLSGTSPWYARGKATFEIWIFDYSIEFDEPWGEKATPDALPALDVRAQLISAISDSRNWNADLPPEAQGIVTLQAAKGAPADAVLHPLSALSITQSVVPMDITITRVGNARPQGQNRFSFERVSVGGSEVKPEPVREHFARAQFVELSETEKLQGPAFEKMNSGVRVSTEPVRHGSGVTAGLVYETFIYNGQTGKTERVGAQAVSEARLTQVAATGASSTRLLPMKARYRAPAQEVRVGWFEYVIASVNDQSVQQQTRTYTEAVQALKARAAVRPRDRVEFQVMSRVTGV